jgi:hypothetical protein
LYGVVFQKLNDVGSRPRGPVKSYSEREGVAATKIADDRWSGMDADARETQHNALFMTACPRTRQNDPKFSEHSGLRIDLYRPTMLLDRTNQGRFPRLRASS